MAEGKGKSRQKKSIYAGYAGYEKFKGRRICPVCEKIFVPHQNTQIVCSEACHKKNEEMFRQFAATCQCTEMDVLNFMLEEAIEKRRRVETQLSASLNELANLKKKYEESLAASRSQDAGFSLKECKRMKLRAFNLPCGQRSQCWQPKKCANVPAGLSEQDVIEPAHDDRKSE